MNPPGPIRIRHRGRPFYPAEIPRPGAEAARTGPGPAERSSFDAGGRPSAGSGIPAGGGPAAGRNAGSGGKRRPAVCPGGACVACGSPASLGVFAIGASLSQACSDAGRSSPGSFCHVPRRQGGHRTAAPGCGRADHRAGPPGRAADVVGRRARRLVGARRARQVCMPGGRRGRVGVRSGCDAGGAKGVGAGPGGYSGRLKRWAAQSSAVAPPASRSAPSRSSGGCQPDHVMPAVVAAWCPARSAMQRRSRSTP